MYTSLTIDYGTMRYTIADVDQKPESALQTLQSIEAVMSNARLHCSVEGMTQEEMWRDLRDRALIITSGYLIKTRQMNPLCRFLQRSRIERDTTAIQALYNRIFSLPIPTTEGWRPTFRGLPTELISQHLLDFLPVTDLMNMRNVGRQERELAEGVLRRRAQEYGYQGEDVAEALNYLELFFKALVPLFNELYHSGSYRAQLYQDSEQRYSFNAHQNHTHFGDPILYIIRNYEGSIDYEASFRNWRTQVGEVTVRLEDDQTCHTHLRSPYNRADLIFDEIEAIEDLENGEHLAHLESLQGMTFTANRIHATVYFLRNQRGITHILLRSIRQNLDRDPFGAVFYSLHNSPLSNLDHFGYRPHRFMGRTFYYIPPNDRIPPHWTPGALNFFGYRLWFR